MFNRYTDPAGWAALTPVPETLEQAAPAFREDPPDPDQTGAPSGLASLKRLLDDRLSDFNADTLVLAALVYFLVADRDEEQGPISDTLLIIGALLLFGL